MSIETLIRQANPVMPEERSSGHSGAPRQLLDEILATPFRQTMRPRPRLIAAGLVVVAVAAVVVTQTLPGPVSTPQQASAVAELHNLSTVVSSLPADTLAPGQFVYTDSVSFGPPAHPGNVPYNVQFDSTRQFWVASDGSGHGVFTASNVTFPTAQDRKEWVAQGSPDIAAEFTRTSTFGPGNYGPMKVDEFTLPTDPAQLSPLIAGLVSDATHAQPGTPGFATAEFGYIGELLQETAAPSDVRAALLTLAASIPGISLIGPDSGPEGVSGIGIATPVTKGGFSEELIFDPTTGALVAEEQWLTDSSGTRTLEQWTSYLASGVVDNTSTTIPVATPSSTTTAAASN
ncbi:MAG: CU044_5270 family protein [Acidimicrobiales bacterium]